MTWLFVIALSALVGCASTILRPGDIKPAQEPMNDPEPEVRLRSAIVRPPAEQPTANKPSGARAGLDNLTAKIDRARGILDRGDSLTEPKR